MNLNLDELLESKKESPPKQIIKLVTNSYCTNRKAVISKELHFMRKLSKGNDWFEEDICNVGAGDILTKILNLNECDDGLYIIGTCNEQRDWESGYVEEYDYKLIPYEKGNDNGNKNT